MKYLSLAQALILPEPGSAGFMSTLPYIGLFVVLNNNFGRRVQSRAL